MRCFPSIWDEETEAGNRNESLLDYCECFDVSQSLVLTEDLCACMCV